MTVTADMIIGDIIMIDEGIAPILMNSGLHCLGCAMASGESLAEACVVHGLDCEAVLKAINDYLASKA